MSNAAVLDARPNRPKPKDLKVTAIVPAHNEEEGLGATIESLLNQKMPFYEIVIVDDCSDDRTREVALSYGVTVITPAVNQGSKAKAQNYGLQQLMKRPSWNQPDLVLPVDADTVLADDYVKLIVRPFKDPDVVIAAGCVMTRFENTWTEKGRSIEYLYGFHWHRPIQNMAASPVVCSGCCSAFDFHELVEFGGFPERTIVEDMDYTWTKQIAGKKAVYVGAAVAWAADPTDAKYLKKQVWRWMSGFFQNVRQHLIPMIRHKPMLAIWILVALWEILTAPLWWAFPFVAIFAMDKNPGAVSAWWFGSELALTIPPLVYAARRRKLSLWKVMRNVPYVYGTKVINMYYAWKGGINELILVPLGWSDGLHDYEKGRAHTDGSDTVKRADGNKVQNRLRMRLDIAFASAGGGAACTAGLFLTQDLDYGVAGLLLTVIAALIAPWRSEGRHRAPKVVEDTAEVTQEISLAEVYLNKAADDPTMPTVGERVF